MQSKTSWIQSALLAGGLASILILPTASAASPISMTPGALGAWVIDAMGSVSTRVGHVDLLFGETSPTPTLVFRTSVIGGGGGGGGGSTSTNLKFDFDFDVEVMSASITGSSGNFSSGPSVFVSGVSGENREVNFFCFTTPCEAEVTFEFATPPTTLDVTDVTDVTDVINEFIDSPGAPYQIFSGMFAFSLPVPALGSAALVLLSGGLAIAAKRALGRS
jgi:hypothetical protein